VLWDDEQALRRLSPHQIFYVLEGFSVDFRVQLLQDSRFFVVVDLALHEELDLLRLEEYVLHL
jgi:hypothetical protein